MTDYLLLSEAKESMGSKTAGGDSKILLYTEEESGNLEAVCRRRFDHRIETRTYSARTQERGGHVQERSLILDDDLISVIEIQNGDATVLAADDYSLLPLNTPYHTLVTLNSNKNLYWTAGNRNPDAAITVTGIWGYGGRWKSLGLTLSGSIDDTTTQIPVNATTGLERRQILRIDSEYMLVDAAVTASPITVERGVNGSTPAAHMNGTPIYRFVPDPQVTKVMRRVLAIRNIQDKSPLLEVVVSGDATAAANTGKIPADVAALIERLTKPSHI